MYFIIIIDSFCLRNLLLCLQQMRKYINLTPKLNRKKQEQFYDKNDLTTKFRTQPKVQKTYSVLYHGISQQKVKTVQSTGLDSISTRFAQPSSDINKTQIFKKGKIKTILKLPSLQSNDIGQINKQKYIKSKLSKDLSEKNVYYATKMYLTLKNSEGSYITGLYRQHFYHYIQIFRFAKNLRVKYPKRIIKLQRRGNSNFKTIYLDLDQTLVHCDQNASKKYTVTLNFPLQDGTVITAGVNIRPFCKQFLRQLSKFAEIIIFTASSSSYADVILDYLDPNKILISHRLYRHHCTYQKGYYLKDLRSVNRNLQNVVLVDNSPYCHLLQPDNAIPIIPFYHYSKDKQLQELLEFLRQLVKKPSMKEEIQKWFYWNLFLNEYGNLPALFIQNYQKK